MIVNCECSLIRICDIVSDSSSFCLANYTLLRRLLLEVKGRPGVDGWSYGGELLLLYMDAISGVSTPSKPAPATVQLAQRLGGPSTADGALRPFQATSFGVPSLAPKGDRAKELQTLLDRISDVERLQIKTGRMGISEEERKQEDLDMRASLAYMRKRVERLATETRKMVSCFSSAAGGRLVLTRGLFSLGTTDGFGSDAAVGPANIVGCLVRWGRWACVVTSKM